MSTDPTYIIASLYLYFILFHGKEKEKKEKKRKPCVWWFDFTHLKKKSNIKILFDYLHLYSKFIHV